MQPYTPMVKGWQSAFPSHSFFRFHSSIFLHNSGWAICPRCSKASPSASKVFWAGGGGSRCFRSRKEPSEVSANIPSAQPALLDASNSSSKSWIAFGAIDMGLSVHKNTTWSISFRTRSADNSASSSFSDGVLPEPSVSGPYCTTGRTAAIFPRPRVSRKDCKMQSLVSQNRF